MKLKLTEKTLATYINKAILSELNEYGFNDAFLWKGQQPDHGAGNSVEIDPATQERINAQNAAKAAKTAAPVRQNQPSWSDDHFMWQRPEQRAQQGQNNRRGNFVEIEPEETPRDENGHMQPQGNGGTQPQGQDGQGNTQPQNGQGNTQPQSQEQGHPFTTKFKVEQFQTWYNLEHNFQGNVRIDGIYGPITKSKWLEYLQSTKTNG